MPKKQNFGPNQGISSRQVLIVVGLTLLAAIAIVLVFIFLLNRGNDNDRDYQNYLNQLKQQANTPTKETNSEGQQILRQTARGVLTEIQTNGLSLTAEGTGQKVDFVLRTDTVITYQGQNFDRSRFYVGDQLEIVARQENNSLMAETITVLVSASPATPAPLPVVTPQNIRPDGSIKPL